MSKKVIRQALCEIITVHGQAIIDNTMLCKGLLEYHCGDSTREVSALVSALEERIPHDLATAGRDTAPQLLSAGLVQRLRDQRGIEEALARWAVETWAMALGRSDLAASVASATIPDNDASATGYPILKLKPGAKARVRFVPKNVEQLLRGIDGIRTQDEVVQLSQLDANTAMQIINELIQHDILEVVFRETQRSNRQCDAALPADRRHVIDPALNTILRFTPGAEAKVRFVPQNVKQLLRGIDGMRSRTEVIQFSQLDARTAAKIINELIKHNVLEEVAHNS